VVISVVGTSVEVTVVGASVVGVCVVVGVAVVVDFAVVDRVVVVEPVVRLLVGLVMFVVVEVLPLHPMKTIKMKSEIIKMLNFFMIIETPSLIFVI
jgi:hypothetical protein